MSLQERAERIVAGKTMLEKELRTASTTERCALCLITDRDDLLVDGDRLRAWQQLDEAQRATVSHFNRSAGFNLAAAAR